MEGDHVTEVINRPNGNVKKRGSLHSYKPTAAVRNCAFIPVSKCSGHIVLCVLHDCHAFH